MRVTKVHNLLYQVHYNISKIMTDRKQPSYLHLVQEINGLIVEPKKKKKIMFNHATGYSNKLPCILVLV